MIAVTRIAGHVVAQPVWRLKILGGFFFIEFHLGNDQAFVALVVKVDLNHAIAERNLITRFLEAFACRGRPESFELRHRSVPLRVLHAHYRCRA